MTTLEQVKAWNKLLADIAKVPDYNLRVALKEEFRRKAIKDWGWVPGENTSLCKKEPEPDLDDWEKEFLMDIRDAIEFGVDTRKEKREKAKALAIEAKLRMLSWIREGHSLYEIPEEIRKPPIVALYNECEKYLRDELWAQVENVTKKAENDKNL